MKNSFIERLGIKLASRSPRRKSITLSQKNIYIFPSKQGWCFILLLSLMLLTAINYQSSLIYLFTFCLGSIFFMSIWMCFINLSGLKILSLEDALGPAHEELSCSFTVAASDHSVFALRLEIPESDSVFVGKIEKGERLAESLMLNAGPRGVKDFPRIRLESRYPFGLIVAWSWVRLDSAIFVHPNPLDQTDRKVAGEALDEDTNVHISSEYTVISDYSPGDPVNRIVWKRLASRNELVVKLPEIHGVEPDWINWEDYSGDTEQRLSGMCFDVLSHSELHKSFGMTLPGKISEPGRGEKHKMSCLKSLASYGAPGQQSLQRRESLQPQKSLQPRESLQPKNSLQPGESLQPKNSPQPKKSLQPKKSFQSGESLQPKNSLQPKKKTQRKENSQPKESSTQEKPSAKKSRANE